ncbi:DNA repair metallo-beta-lactamase [Penicillium taxi]|uniref:DNA repair metallo-beta-lactamase n=1 Tax=Penicillium taxi TaxID=168475 RepID=UPI0025458A6A|nr:DNA repair metallo-beta-lactamase [Penicillium taxi]KAJ5893396.1 DNA repair metallo-beta-lactamase [Penicillium taxi]
MSTFDGIVTEFPDIQIDNFRKPPDGRPPLACFLSHVHSDHLFGLESFRIPFIYCSQATRELLLRIEKYPHRMNFQKGILESRRLHYKHLARLLRPIPLNTPTEIELTPRRKIRVTLFDANHCCGAVMFLIEGDGKTIIYTGDIRAEPWWVSGLVRHPILIPYTLGRKKLDKLYLDTTFAASSDPFRRFPSKAEGLAELLQKLDAYPDDTIFYFRAWTFGYEEVWLAMAAALNTTVHLDRYQMGLYRSLSGSSSGRPALCGFNMGNRGVAGCLSDQESSRIHSCEPGVSCPVARSPNTVYIVPIVNRSIDGAEIPEVGAGGGIGDLYQTHELELPNETALVELEKLCLQLITDKNVLLQTQKKISDAFQSGKRTLSLDKFDVQAEENISLERLVAILSDSDLNSHRRADKADLPNTIRFPYSRHSSYEELCELVTALKPYDIHPCTVDQSSWSENVSMERLFGHLCPGDNFSHDIHMHETLDEDYNTEHTRKRARYARNRSPKSTPSSGVAEESDHSVQMIDIAKPMEATHESNAPAPEREHANRDDIRRAHRYLQEHADPGILQIDPLPSWTEEDSGTAVTQRQPAVLSSPTLADFQIEGGDVDSSQSHSQHSASRFQQDSQLSDTLTISLSMTESITESDSQKPARGGRDRVMARYRARMAAFIAAQRGTYSAWEDVSLVSAGGHTQEEPEL